MIAKPLCRNQTAADKRNYSYKGAPLYGLCIAGRLCAEFQRFNNLSGIGPGIAQTNPSYGYLVIMPLHIPKQVDAGKPYDFNNKDSNKMATLF